MQPPQVPKGIFAGFALVAVLFLTLYFLLSFHNRPAADDFYCLTAIRNKGIWLTFLDAYNTWITRWSTLLFLGFSVVVFDAGQSLFFFQLFTLAAMTTAAGLLIHKIAKETLGSSPGIYLIVVYALLFVFSFFYLTFNTGETWFWFTSECMYLWPVIALLYGSYFFLSKEIKTLSLVLLVSCFLFIGGGSEVVALEVLMALLMAWILLYRNRMFGQQASLNKRLLTISIGVVILSLFIAWLGPGRLLRQEALNPADISQQLLLILKASLYFLLAQLPLKTHWILFSLVPWLVLKNSLMPGEKKPIPVVFRSVARDFLIFLLFVFINFIIVAFLLRSFPPYRTWITLSLALAVFCAITGWRLGSLVQKQGVVWASVIYFVLVVMLLIAYINSQGSLTAQYSKEVDDRMIYLKNNSAVEKPVLDLKPLPSSGLLYSAEINNDTSYFTNKQLREYLELKSAVRKGGYY